jgi:hypothetical protein
LKDLEASWNTRKRQFEAKTPEQIFGVSEGPQLRVSPSKEVERVSQVKGEKVLDVTVLKRFRRIFSFANIELPKNDENYLRVRGGWKGLAVCRPPHVMVSAARNFAVFSNKFIIVPPRQIGITSVHNDVAHLKALALYLSSDFIFYHQFLTATQFGVRGVATLESLRQIPVFLSTLSRRDLKPWVTLHDQLAQTAPRHLADTLLDKLNNLVSAALRLDERERALVDDLVHVRLALNGGKIGDEAVRTPSPLEMQTYARWLRRELDTFVGESNDRRHAVTVIHDASSAMVAVDFTKHRDSAGQLRVLEATAADARALDRTRQRLRTRRAQWVYFDRSLRIYEDRKTYVFKPLQRFHWTRTQAIIDAGEIIADTISNLQ